MSSPQDLGITKEDLLQAVVQYAHPESVDGEQWQLQIDRRLEKAIDEIHPGPLMFVCKRVAH